MSRLQFGTGIAAIAFLKTAFADVSGQTMDFAFKDFPSWWSADIRASSTAVIGSARWIRGRMHGETTGMTMTMST